MNLSSGSDVVYVPEGSEGKESSRDSVRSRAYFWELHRRMHNSVNGCSGGAEFYLAEFFERAHVLMGYMQVFSNKTGTSLRRTALLAYYVCDAVRFLGIVPAVTY